MPWAWLYVRDFPRPLFLYLPKYWQNCDQIFCNVFMLMLQYRFLLYFEINVWMIYELCCVYAKNDLVNNTCGRGINKRIATPDFSVILARLDKVLILHYWNGQWFAKNVLVNHTWGRGINKNLCHTQVSAILARLDKILPHLILQCYAKNPLVLHTCGRGINQKLAVPTFVPFGQELTSSKNKQNTLSFLL